MIMIMMKVHAYRCQIERTGERREAVRSERMAAGAEKQV
jgi:hypothetical protein